MSIAKSHVRYVFYMADDYDIMSGARLYQTRSAKARMRMANHLSCAKAHDVMSRVRLYQTRSAKARMRTLVYGKTHRRNKSETQAQLQLIKTSGFFNPGFYMYRISFFHSMSDKAGNIP